MADYIHKRTCRGWSLINFDAMPGESLPPALRLRERLFVPLNAHLFRICGTPMHTRMP